MSASVLTVCPFCACGCGLYLHSANGNALGAMPSEHHPVSHGTLCARGWAAHEASLWGRRLTRPQVRRNGALEATDWATALRAAQEGLAAVLARGGAIGVLGSPRATNEENFLAVRLARGTLRTGHVDSALRAPYQALRSGLLGRGSPPDSATALDDLEQCQVILLLEEDLARSHPRVASAILKAVRRGARLVTMGPAATQMSRLAWLRLALLPGDEPVLAARLAAAADAAAPLDAPTPAAGDPGVGRAPLMPQAALRRATDAYAAAARAAIVLAPNGAACAWLEAVAHGFADLAARTGHLRRAGSVLLPLPHRSNSRGALEMGAAPNCLPGPCDLDDEPALKRLHRAWGCEPIARRGLDFDEMLGTIRALVVLADDPLTTAANRGHVAATLGTLDCLVVLDAFATPTAAASHVALPIASPAESAGTYTSLEGRVQRVCAAAPPPGDARPGWWALAELAAALGTPRIDETETDVLRGIAAAVPGYAGVAPTEGAPSFGAIGVAREPFEDSAARAARSDEACRSILGTLGAAVEPESSDAYPFRLVRVGSFDWGDDPLADASPTLRRDYVSQRKLHPLGYVEMSARDAERLGVRHGWKARIRSAHGEAITQLSLRKDLEPGVLLAPFAFRDQLEPVLRRKPLAAVAVERV